MKATLLFAALIIFAVVYWLVGFVNVLHDDVDVSHGLKTEREQVVTGDRSKYTVDSLGNEVLLLSKLTKQEKRNAWNSSVLKNDMLAIFPRFSEIRFFIDTHIEDDGVFKKELVAHINKVEREYITGSITGERAKARLSHFN